MTEKQKGGKAENAPGTLSLADVADISHDVINKLIPGSRALSLLDIWHKALSSLRTYLEADKSGNAWKLPIIELQYDVRPEDLDEPPPEALEKRLTQQEALDLAKKLYEEFPAINEKAILENLTRGVAIRSKGNWREDGELVIPEGLRTELDALPEDERTVRLEKIALGFRDLSDLLKAWGTVKTADGQDQEFEFSVQFIILPLLIFPDQDRAYYPILAGLNFTKGDPFVWTDESRGEIWEKLFSTLEEMAAGFGDQPERAAIRKPDRILPARPENFNVPGKWVRTIYTAADSDAALPGLREFYDIQTPLTWAIGHTLFSLTSEDRIRAGGWQEASVHDIEDIVFQLAERGVDRHGQNREDLLTEIVKLCTTPNWYYEIRIEKCGRTYRQTGVKIGAIVPIPEFEFIYWDNEKKQLARPADPALSKQRTWLEVKGRRIAQPDGKQIPALPKGRYTWTAFRWRWVQSFNDDLIMAPALIEEGRQKGLPKKTASGRVIRKGYLIRVSNKIISALRILRAEGRGDLYAARLLIVLAHDIGKTEDGIAADRVFRRLGFIPRQDGRGYKTTTHERPEDIVARAVWRLKQPDIGALKPGSDEMPRTDPNPDRRKGAYYRFFRTPDFMPQKGIVTKEEAESIEREYAPPQLPAAHAEAASVETQATLPGLEPPAIQRPTGADIRAARTAAEMDLRTFARTVAKGLSHTAWARIEKGAVSEAALARIPADVWQRVQAFLDQGRMMASRNDGKAE